MVDDPVKAVGLEALMARTEGRRGVVIGLIDGPIAVAHPDLAAARIAMCPGVSISCSDVLGPSCRHGTFVAGILTAHRRSCAPAVAPGCTLLVRPVFREGAELDRPNAGAGELAEAIIDCVDQGAAVINMSLSVAGGPAREYEDLVEALNYATRRSVLLVAAAGQVGYFGSSRHTQHSWVIPVAMTSDQTQYGSVFARSHVLTGLTVPARGVASLCPSGGTTQMSGTSVAAAFVTGALALLLSLLPEQSPSTIWQALLSSRLANGAARRAPVMDVHGTCAELFRQARRD